MGFGVGNVFKKAKSVFTDVSKGVGNLLTGGALSQADALKEAKKARDQAASQYQSSIDAATAEAERIANIEEERKRRLLLYGTQAPPTLINTFLGVGGSGNVARPTLG